MRFCLLFLSCFAFAGSASAACFELIGCTDSDRYRRADLRQLSCENLWLVRNTLYDENGYCFRTKKALTSFDNADCWVHDQEKVKMSLIERGNLESILGVEQAMGCR